MHLSSQRKKIHTYFSSKLILKTLFAFCFICLATFGNGQTTVFSETFDETENSMAGTSSEGISWVATCPSCKTGDFFEVRSGSLYAEDTNADLGTATFTFSVPAASLSAFDHFSLVFNLTGAGNVYESSGTNAMDYVQVEYSFGTGGFTLMDGLIGNDINIGQIMGTDILLGSGDLNIRVSVQNWAHDEDIKLNDITVSASAPLPVELSYFGGSLNRDNDVELNWSTATENNNEVFIVEKSTDQLRFEEVHTQKGAGNSTEPIHYSFMDKRPAQGMNYYRLKQVDFDGTTTFSKVISVKLNHENTVQVFPTVASHAVTVSIQNPTEEAQIFVFDFSGKLIQNQTIEAEQSDYKLNVEALPAGPYFIKLSGKNHDQTLRFFRS